MFKDIIDYIKKDSTLLYLPSTKKKMNGKLQTCLMSVYTSLRSSSSSLYGSIEESESVSVSCKVVNRRQ